MVYSIRIESFKTLSVKSYDCSTSLQILMNVCCKSHEMVDVNTIVETRWGLMNATVDRDTNWPMIKRLVMVRFKDSYNYS